MRKIYEKILEKSGPVVLGHIKIGKKGALRKSRKGNTFRMPEKLDHIIVTTTMRDENDDFIPDVELMADLAEQGFADDDGKLRRIPIQFPSDQIEENLFLEYAKFAGSKPVMRSDGETVTWYQDGKATRKEPWRDEFLDDGDIKVYGTLNVMIASRKTSLGGVYRFRTTSQISASQLARGIYDLRQSLGNKLRGVPLELALSPRKTSKGEVFVVSVESRIMDLEALQQKAIEFRRSQVEFFQQAREEDARMARLLSASSVVDADPDEQEDIAQEFTPGQYKASADAETVEELDDGEVEIEENKSKSASDAALCKRLCRSFKELYGKGFWRELVMLIADSTGYQIMAGTDENYAQPFREFLTQAKAEELSNLNQALQSRIAEITRGD